MRKCILVLYVVLMGILFPSCIEDNDIFPENSETVQNTAMATEGKEDPSGEGGD